MTATRLVIVSAGLRVPSSTRLLADELGAAVSAALRARDGAVHVEVIELREVAHPIVDALLTGFPAGELRSAVDAVLAADALIVVSPTFSAALSGLFKSFFDLFGDRALPGTPTLLAATGGTERHSLVIEHALRPLLTYLGADPVRTGVYAATSDFGGAGAARLRARVLRGAEELAGAVLDRARRGEPSGNAASGASAADAVEEVVPFEELLARGGGAASGPADGGTLP